MRERSPSFADHFSQATQFWNSMSDWEKDHIAAAFAFELNQVVDEPVRARTMNEILVNIHRDLADMVSRATGIVIAPAGTLEEPTPSAPTPSGPSNKNALRLKSPALSMDKPAPSIVGRKVAILLADGADADEIEATLAALGEAGLVPETIGPTAGSVQTSGKAIKVNRAADNAPSVVYDAVLVPAGIGGTLATMTLAQRFLHEAYRHGKPIAAAEDATGLLHAAQVPAGRGYGERRRCCAGGQPCRKSRPTPFPPPCVRAQSVVIRVSSSRRRAPGAPVARERFRTVTFFVRRSVTEWGMVPEKLTDEEYTVTILDALGVIERVFGLSTWEEVRVRASQADTDGHAVEVEEARSGEPDHTLH